MIPSTNIQLDIADAETQTSDTYRMDTTEELICGSASDIDAMKQAIFKILQTERYENLIYSANYGVELADLFGQPLSYVQPELERRISEALLQDERIQSVSDFAFEQVGKSELLVTFKVGTVFGDINEKTTVNI